jgi:hypothetical protein
MHAFPLLTSTSKYKFDFSTRIEKIHGIHSLYNVLAWVTLFLIIQIYLRNNSWKPYLLSSFNMGNIIYVNILSRAIARDKMQPK